MCLYLFSLFLIKKKKTPRGLFLCKEEGIGSREESSAFIVEFWKRGKQKSVETGERIDTTRTRTEGEKGWKIDRKNKVKQTKERRGEKRSKLIKGG